jgi:hypothetical protein
VNVFITFNTGLPLVLLCAWATVMEINYPVECWRDYSEQPYIWILIAPMIFALVVRFINQHLSMSVNYFEDT